MYFGGNIILARSAKSELKELPKSSTSMDSCFVLSKRLFWIVLAADLPASISCTKKLIISKVTVRS